MRILLVTQYWAPENGVPQRRWAWLSRVLERAGHEVVVLAPPPHYLRQEGWSEWWRSKGYRSNVENASESNGGRLVLRSGFIPGGASISQKVLNQLGVAAGGLWVVLRRKSPIDSYNPDLIIGTVPALPTALVAMVASWRFKIPYVVDLRDAWPDLLNVAEQWNVATGKVSLRQAVLSKGPLQAVTFTTDRVLTLILKNAGAILSTSSDLAEDLNRRYQRSPSIWTIRNVFPPETQIKKSVDVGESSAVLNVLYAGTLGRAQNLSNALVAAHLAEAEGVRVRLRFVGAGAAKRELIQIAEELRVEATFEKRRGAEQLAECYEWADTALVHLTDWPPLEKAVPSKTYELISQGLHISGVVRGETKTLIEALKAGHTVEPENPEQLTRLWIELARDRTKLMVPDIGAQWVQEQREKHAPANLLDCIQHFETVEKNA